MVTKRNSFERGHTKLNWLNSYHSFSFGEYYDPNNIHFGPLRVLNDDTVQPKNGFSTHSHKDMEIISIVLEGTMTHKDSTGIEGTIHENDVQYMSAGAGIYHSEFNLESEDTNLFQIWIYPKENSIEPQWDSRRFPKETVGESLTLMVSGFEKDQADDVLYIHQDARIFGGALKAGQIINHTLSSQAYLLVSEGKINLEGMTLNKGDGAEITELENITIKALDDAEVVIIEVPTDKKL